MLFESPFDQSAGHVLAYSGCS